MSLCSRNFCLIFMPKASALRHQNLCTKSLVLKKKPRKKKLTHVTTGEALKTVTAKKKVKVVSKQPSDYCEDTWLSGLNASNLKLYRKTSFGVCLVLALMLISLTKLMFVDFVMALVQKQIFIISGSFRKINVNNLIGKLKSIYPELDTEHVKGSEKDNINPKTGSEPQSGDLNNAERNLELASPQLSEFLVKNMLHFPMLKKNSLDGNPLTAVFKEEENDYGVVDSTNFPSVTKILQETMSPLARKRLEEWSQAMIKKMGAKEFQKYSKDLLAEGAKLHRCLKTYLEAEKKEEVVVDPAISGCWTSLDNLLPDITNVKMVEEHIHHPVLMYKGIVDCVANYQDSPCVIEWKKSGKPKSHLSDTHDAPLQLCAYLGALSWHKSFLPETQGLVVVAYSTGCPADVFPLDFERCQLYWMEWLKRLQAYWYKKSSVLVREEAPEEV